MNIAFFVTNHGYGHIMRELPVIAELLNRGNRIILVTAEKHIQMAEQYLQAHIGMGELITIADKVDVGIIVVPGTLKADWMATELELRKFIASWPEKKELVQRVISEYNIDRIVADIVPWVIPAAKEADIPVYLSSNFTWLEQYEGNLPDDIIQPFREAYAAPDNVFLQALASDRMRTRYPQGIDVGFFCRPFDEEKVKEIKGRYRLPIVYISVGGSNSGLNGTVDVSDLPYQFIVTSGLDYRGDNVVHLPVETDNTNDYIAVANYCITKAGWGTVAEEMIAGVRTALIERPDVPEDMDNIGGLGKNAIVVNVNMLKEPGAIIKLLNRMEPSTTQRNNYKVVADLITG